MSSTIAALRNQNNPWDPNDDEWGSLVDMYHASYRAPIPRSPTKTKGFLATIKATFSGKEEGDDEEEEVQRKVEQLGNTYYFDANGDANDDIMQQAFGRPTKYVPGGVSPRQMHLIDLDAYFLAEDELLQHARPRLCDAVTTILSHTNAACLSAFLDPRVEEFVLKRKVDNNEGGLILVIRREGNEVICGAYRNLGFKMLWKVYVKSRVGVTGEWYEVHAAKGVAEMSVVEGGPEWGVVRTGGEEVEIEEKTTAEGLQRKLELSPSKKKCKQAEDGGETDPKLMLFQSRVLAMHLLWDIWFRFDRKYECRATWSADGVEEVVRLSRSVVGSGEDDD